MYGVCVYMQCILEPTTSVNVHNFMRQKKHFLVNFWEVSKFGPLSSTKNEFLYLLYNTMLCRSLSMSDDTHTEMIVYTGNASSMGNEVVNEEK